MARRLFSDISPLTYQIAIQRQRLQRHLADLPRRRSFAAQRSAEDLPTRIYGHNSLIRRRLGSTEQHLQEGKARSLAIAAPLVDGILIRPGQTFSFWRLVGNPTAARGFQPGWSSRGTTRSRASAAGCASSPTCCTGWRCTPS